MARRAATGWVIAQLAAAACLAATGPALAPASAQATPSRPVEQRTQAPMLQSMPPSAHLSAAQLQQLLKVIKDKGSDITVPPDVVSVLQLTDAQVAPKVRQVTFQQQDGIKHGFAPLNDGSGYFLFSRTPSASVTVYRLGPGLKLIRAAHDFEGHRMIALPDSEAAVGLQQEIVRWSNVLSPPAASLPRAAGDRAP